MEKTEQRPLYSWVVAMVALAIAVAVVAGIGAAQAARGVRILGSLEPAAALLRIYGQALISTALANAVLIAQVVTSFACTIAIAAVIHSRRQAPPLLLMAAAFSLATWGEVSLLSGALPRGTALYALGFVAAVLWGFLRPLPQPITLSARGTRFEPLIVFALGILTLLTRTYALTELVHDIEAEMIVSMFSSRTLAGLHQYIPWGLTDNTNGIAHLLPQWAAFSLFGPSVFSLRLVSVVCGLFTTALFYTLLRRLGGLYVAVLGTLFFITAPDQLFWSRQENTPFQFVALSGVIAASLGLRFVERPNPRTLIAACVWMPLSRLFYGPAMVMMLFPPLLYLHALVFGRVSRRTLWYAIPTIAVAALLWVFSLSAACSVVSGHICRFINPTLSAGAPVWQGEGTFRHAALADLVQLQIANLTKNATTVAQSMTYSGGFTNWYRRNDSSSRPTTVNVVVTVLLTIGIGYLLGQLNEPRAFALVAWVGLGMLPALLSVDPVPRRMVTAFPGFYAVIAATLGALLWQLRASAHRMATALTHGVLALAVPLVTGAAMASYFLLPQQGTYLDRLLRVTKPIFAESDAIYHNVGPDWELVLAFGHSDVLFAKRPTPCFEGTKPRQFLQRVLNPTCTFQSPAMAFTLTQAELDALQSKFNPQVFTFFMRDDLTTAHDVELLHQLLPKSPVTKLDIGNVIASRVVSLRTDRATLEDLSAPSLRIGSQAAADPELPSKVIVGTRAQLGEPLTGEGLELEASLVVDRGGWYKFRLQPECAQAQLLIDGATTSTDHWMPLTSNAHQLSLKLPAASTCAMPFKLVTARRENGADVATDTPLLAAPRVAALTEARAQPVGVIAGYQEQPFSLNVSGTVLDFVVEPNGLPTILVDDHGVYRVVRLNPAGDQEAGWELPQAPIGLSLAPDGTLFVPFPGGKVIAYTRDGAIINTWENTPVRSETLGHLASGSLLSPVADRNAVAVIDRSGRVVDNWRDFKGGPKVFFEPWSAGVNADGDVLIIQTDGVALQFRTPTDQFAPEFVRSFRIDFYEPSAPSRGWAFDQARGRILVADPTSRNIYVFNLDGARLMASDPANDLGQQKLEIVRRISASGDAVYVLDSTHRVRKFRPLDRG